LVLSFGRSRDISEGSQEEIRRQQKSNKNRDSEEEEEKQRRQKKMSAFKADQLEVNEPDERRNIPDQKQAEHDKMDLDSSGI
jgi:hypothetical protein